MVYMYDKKNWLGNNAKNFNSLKRFCKWFGEKGGI